MRKIENANLITPFVLHNGKSILVRVLDNSTWLEFTDLAQLLQQSPDSLKVQIAALFDQKKLKQNDVHIFHKKSNKDFYNLVLIEKLTGNILERNFFIFFSLLLICFQDLTTLLKNHEIFKSFSSIVGENMHLPINNPFFASSFYSFKLTLLVLIRKLTDKYKKKSTVSLVLALEKLIELANQSPELLTREYYLKRYPQEPLANKIGNKNFDKIIGSTDSDFDFKIIEKDICTLKEAPIGLINKLTNTRGVHFSQDELEQKPTNKDLEDAINKIKTVVIKYFKIVDISLPESQYRLQPDWDDIFKIPWISSKLTQNFVIQKLKQNLPRFQQELGVNQIYLYGSFARGDQTKSSDIDILVDFENKVQKEKSFIFDYIKNDLHNIFHRKIDVVAKDAIDPIIKKSIQKEIIPIG